MSVIGTTGTPFSTALAVRGKRVKQATARPSMDVPAGAALPTRAARGGQKPARAGGTAEASRRGRRVGRTPQGGAGGGQAQRPALGSPHPPRGGSPALSHRGGRRGAFCCLCCCHSDSEGPTWCLVTEAGMLKTALHDKELACQRANSPFTYAVVGAEICLLAASHPLATPALEVPEPGTAAGDGLVTQNGQW